MPVYNAESYLGESVRSVVDQTLEDYELLLMDDGSTDESGDLCDALAVEDGRIRVTHLKNGGPLVARERGLAQARGTYVLMLDADDALRSDALEILRAATEEELPDAVFFEYSRAQSFAPYPSCSLPFTRGMHSGEDVEVLREVICRGFHTNAMWGKAYRRDVVPIATEDELAEHDGMAHAEDLYQLVPIVDRVQRFFYCAEPLYYYRPTPGSSTKAYRPRQLDDLAVAVSELLSYADKWGGTCQEEARNGAIRQCIYLLHILVCDRAAAGQRREEYGRLVAQMRKLGLFGPWETALRVDKRLESRALRSGAYLCSAVLARIFELLKSMRDRRAACQ